MVLTAAWVTMLLAYTAWQTQPPNLLTYAYDYDEGIYAQKGWALQRGYQLYTDIWSAHPPLVPYVVAATFAAMGPSIAAARVAMVILSIAALAGVGIMAARAGGWQAGLGAVGLLALSQHFTTTARSVSPEVPALGFATLAIACATRYVGGQSFAWWLAAAVALGVGMVTKLTALLALPPVAILLVATHRRHLASRAVARDLAVLAGPTLVVYGWLLWRVDPMLVFDQLVLVAARSENIFPPDPALTVRSLAEMVKSNPLPFILAPIGILALWRRCQKPLLATYLLWFGLVLAALLLHRPLFSHHLVLLLPPAAVFGGIGLAEAIPTVAQLLEGRTFARRKLFAVLSVGALAVAIVALPRTIVLNVRGVPNLDAAWREPSEAISAVDAVVSPESSIVTDEQMLALAAGRKVPAGLADTSTMRILAGYLTTRELQDVIERERPAAILFWSERFDKLPDFRPWVEENFRRGRSFGPGRDLYVAA